MWFIDIMQNEKVKRELLGKILMEGCERDDADRYAILDALRGIGMEGNGIEGTDGLFRRVQRLKEMFRY